MPELCPHCGATLPMVRDAFCSECGNDLDEASPRPVARNDPEGGQRGADEPSDALWYATGERVFALVKLSWYDDRGTVGASPGGLRFAGKQGTWVMGRVTAVRPIGPVVPWAAGVSLVAGNVAVWLLAWAGAFQFLTLDNPLTYLLLGGLDLFVISGWPLTWVKVDYQDEGGRPLTAYFTAAARTGRWLGGANRLCERLRQLSGQTAGQ
jgi:hypothetical protein